jgi:hypothetical protein
MATWQRTKNEHVANVEKENLKVQRIWKRGNR